MCSTRNKKHTVGCVCVPRGRVGGQEPEHLRRPPEPVDGKHVQAEDRLVGTSGVIRSVTLTKAIDTLNRWSLALRGSRTHLFTGNFEPRTTERPKPERHGRKDLGTRNQVTQAGNKRVANKVRQISWLCQSHEGVSPTLRPPRSRPLPPPQGVPCISLVFCASSVEQPVQPELQQQGYQHPFRDGEPDKS